MANLSQYTDEQLQCMLTDIQVHQSTLEDLFYEVVEEQGKRKAKHLASQLNQLLI